MPHTTVIIINSAPVPAAPGSEDQHPQVEVSVTYRPPHSTGPKEIAQTVERIARRIDGIADAFPDE